MVVQFALLQYQYHGPYRVRASPWLNGNIRGAMERMIEEAGRDRDAPIVFATLRSGLGRWDLKNRWLPAYWRFYIAKAGREDLLARTVFFTYLHETVPIVPGSLVMGNTEDPHLKQLLTEGATRIADIPEIDRDPVFHAGAPVTGGEDTYPSMRRSNASVGTSINPRTICTVLQPATGVAPSSVNGNTASESGGACASSPIAPE